MLCKLYNYSHQNYNNIYLESMQYVNWQCRIKSMKHKVYNYANTNKVRQFQSI